MCEDRLARFILRCRSSLRIRLGTGSYRRNRQDKKEPKTVAFLLAGMSKNSKVILKDGHSKTTRTTSAVEIWLLR
jgi:hypothetical protein